MSPFSTTHVFILLIYLLLLFFNFFLHILFSFKLSLVTFFLLHIPLHSSFSFNVSSNHTIPDKLTSISCQVCSSCFESCHCYSSCLIEPASPRLLHDWYRHLRHQVEYAPLRADPAPHRPHLRCVRREERSSKRPHFTQYIGFFDGTVYI